MMSSRQSRGWAERRRPWKASVNDTVQGGWDWDWARGCEGLWEVVGRLAIHVD